MKRARELLIFLLGAAIVALLTILIGRGQNPDFGASICLSTTEPALSRTLDDVQIDRLTLDQAIAVLSEKAHLPIRPPDRKILEGKGIDPDTRVTLHTGQITLASALREILEPFDALHADLTFWPDGNSIRIGSTADSVVLQIYDLRGFNLHEPADSNPNDPESLGINFVPRRSNGLSDIIEFVAPDTWSDSGGTLGYFQLYASKLAVAQTWENQQAISGLLRDLAPTSTGQLLDQPSRPSPPSQLYLWSGESNRFVPVAESPAEAALRRELPEVDIRQRTMEDALTLLGEQAHVAATVNWRYLEGIGTGRDGLVTLTARKIPLALALGRLLSVGTEQVGLRPDGSTIYIGSPSNSLSTRVYDLRGYFETQLDGPANQRRFSMLIQTIQTTIDPRSWIDAGGEVGAIFIFDSKLVISQGWSDQEAIADLLGNLRRGAGGH